MPDVETQLDLDVIHDNLLKAMTDDVLRILGDAGLVRLKHPVEDYLNCCLERMLNDITTNLTQENYGSEPTGNTSSPISCSPGNVSERSRKAASSSIKRKTLHEHTEPCQKPDSNETNDLEDKSNLNNLTKAAKVSRTSEFLSYSCPFRKRNPKRFNVRDPQRRCALTPFSSLPLLKYEICIGRCVMMNNIS